MSVNLKMIMELAAIGFIYVFFFVFRVEKQTINIHWIQFQLKWLGKT